MLKLAIRNLAKNALDDLAGEKLFADTNKGKFVLRTASYEDELAFLVTKLHKRGKLTWSKKSSDKYVAEYKGLKIEVGDGNSLTKRNLVITVSEDQYVLSKSPLVAALAHIIWHVLDTPHAHISLRHDGNMRNYYDEQEKVAKKVIDILKSR